MTERMGQILTVPEVALRAGWCCEKAKKAKKHCGASRTGCRECWNGYHRMLRHLRTQNEQLGGMLLVNTALPGRRPRYTLTLQALEQLHPQWFSAAKLTADRLDELESKVEELDELLVQAHRTNGELRRRIEVLEKGRAA